MRILFFGGTLVPQIWTTMYFQIINVEAMRSIRSFFKTLKNIDFHYLTAIIKYIVVQIWTFNVRKCHWKINLLPQESFSAMQKGSSCLGWYYFMKTKFRQIDQKDLSSCSQRTHSGNKRFVPGLQNEPLTTFLDFMRFTSLWDVLKLFIKFFINLTTTES